MRLNGSGFSEDWARVTARLRWVVRIETTPRECNSAPCRGPSRRCPQRRRVYVERGRHATPGTSRAGAVESERETRPFMAAPDAREIWAQRPRGVLSARDRSAALEGSEATDELDHGFPNERTVFLHFLERLGIDPVQPSQLRRRRATAAGATSPLRRIRSGTRRSTTADPPRPARQRRCRRHFDRLRMRRALPARCRAAATDHSPVPAPAWPRDSLSTKPNTMEHRIQ